MKKFKSVLNIWRNYPEHFMEGYTVFPQLTIKWKYPTSLLWSCILKCWKNKYSFSSFLSWRSAYFSTASYPKESNDMSGPRRRHVGVLLVLQFCSFVQSLFKKISSFSWPVLNEKANPLNVVPKSMATTAIYDLSSFLGRTVGTANIKIKRNWNKIRAQIERLMSL